MKKRKGNLLIVVVVFAMLAGFSTTALASASVTRKSAERRAHMATDIYTCQSLASIVAQQLMHDLGTITVQSPYDPLDLTVAAYQTCCDSVYTRLFGTTGRYVVSDMAMIIDYAGIKDTDLKTLLMGISQNAAFTLKAEQGIVLNYAARDNVLEFADTDQVALNDFSFSIELTKGNMSLTQRYSISNLYIEVEHASNSFKVVMQNDLAKCELVEQSLRDGGKYEK